MAIIVARRRLATTRAERGNPYFRTLLEKHLLRLLPSS